MKYHIGIVKTVYNTEGRYMKKQIGKTDLFQRPKSIGIRILCGRTCLSDDNHRCQENLRN